MQTCPEGQLVESHSAVQVGTSPESGREGRHMPFPQSGRKLVLPLQALYEWAVQHRPEMLVAREKFQSKQRKMAQRPL